MMKSQWRPFAVLVTVLAILAAACGGDGGDTDNANNSGDGGSPASGETTELTILGTLKPEIAPQFEAAVEAYNGSQSQYAVEIVPLAQDFLQTATAMYSSGNAPTIMIMSQEIPEFQDRLLDLSGTEVANNALPGTLNQATMADGRVVGVPQTIEAYGLLYNKAVLDEAVGGTFDPTSIKTRSELSDLMTKIDGLEGTDAAMQLSPMDWSLGAHLTNMMYAPRSTDRDERLAFFKSLEAGEVDLANDQLFNGWLDTVDVFRANNELASSPLAADYDDGVSALASGKVGLWFMGNWALPNLVEANPDGEFGIMPMPISDNADDYGNSQISVGVPSYITVDAEQSSEAQQKGAIDFLNWLTSSEEGTRYYVEEFLFLPAYKSISQTPEDMMSQQILTYTSDENTLEWMNSLYPADAWPSFGATLQKYISDNTDRGGVATEFSDYWKSVDA